MPVSLWWVWYLYADEPNVRNRKIITYAMQYQIKKCSASKTQAHKVFKKRI